MMMASSPSVNDSLQTTCCPVPAATLTSTGATLDAAPGGGATTAMGAPLQPPPGPGAPPTQPRKAPSSTASLRPPSSAAEQLGSGGVRCPRCDSPNTKFCYYNNYSLAQPRHFCKTCRRYWTRGGALRNVPVGGGCRKNKGSKSKSSSASSVGPSTASSLGAPGGLFSSHSASSPTSDYKARAVVDPKLDFFQQAAAGRLSLVVPQVTSSNMALQLGMGGTLAFANNSRLFSPVASNINYFDGFYSPSHHDFGVLPSAATATISTSPQDKPSSPVGATSIIGFSYPLSIPPTTEIGRACLPTSSTSLTNGNGSHSQLASSIESLSILNQDLHWRLQQQRLAMLYGTSGDGASGMTFDGAAVGLSPQAPLLYEVERQHQATTTTTTPCTCLPFPTSLAHADEGGSKPPAAADQLQVAPGGYGGSGNDVWLLHGSTVGGNSNSNSEGNSNSNGWSTIAATHPWSELHQFGAVP